MLGLSSAAVLSLLAASCAALPNRAFTAITLAPRSPSDATCGYYNGDAASPLTCATTSTCGFNSANWGCCDEKGCDNHDFCVGYGEASCNGTASADCPYTQILQCEAASPACATYTRETYADDEQKLTSWKCAPTPAKVLIMALPTTTGAGGDGASGSTTFSRASPSPTLALPSSTASSTESSSVHPSPTTTSAPTSSPSPPAGGGGGGGLSDGDVIVIVLGIATLTVAVIVGWLKPREFLWFITAGYLGRRPW